MGKVAVSVEVPGPVAEVEALWYDPARWPAWVDGFGHVVEVGEAWPQAGARALWDTPHGGRGRVVERVVRHEAGRGQECDVEDARLRGRRLLSFSPAPGGAVTLTVVFEYTLKADHAFGWAVDALAVRRNQAAAQRRTLARFARERAADVEWAREDSR
jgi:Polyketide cyclase / dehydrase and lipid transport